VRPVKVKICTEVDGTSFFVRWLEITNTARQRMNISAVP